MFLVGRRLVELELYILLAKVILLCKMVSFYNSLARHCPAILVFAFPCIFLSFHTGNSFINNWDSFRENGPSFIMIKSYKIVLHLNRNNFRTVKVIVITSERLRLS